MNRARVLVGLVASFGVAVAAACGGGSSSNGNGNGNGASSSSGGSSGVSSGASSGGTETGDDSGGNGCASGQLQCMALLGGTSCIEPGTMCVGTAVAANECSATSPCSGGQVCCSSFVGPDGGVIMYADASADAAAATGTGTAGGETVSVQCMTACPTNALSSQVCVLDADGGSPTACPEGTACQDYLPSFLASMTLPNTLCLPIYDGGGYVYPRPDGSTGTATADASSATGTDATPVTDATSQ
jgi:hypothetical protein